MSVPHRLDIFKHGHRAVCSGVLISSLKMGVIDEEGVARIIDLPEGETVAALITYGYPAEEVAPTARKAVDALARFVD